MKLEERTKSKQDNPLGSALTGVLAGVVSKTATAPIERVKLLLQVRQSNTAATSYGDTFWQVSRDVYQREGLLSFWRGNTPSVLQKSGNAALNFMLMDYYKMIISILMSSRDDNNVQSRFFRNMNSFLSAGLAGGTSTSLMYPLEFLRTQLAADLAQGPEKQQYFGMRDVFSHTVTKDGIRGLYQGFGTSLWFVTLHRVVYLGGFDVAKTEWLGMQRQKDRLGMGERVVIAQGVSMLAATVCYPLDTVRRRLMMQAGKDKRQYRNWWDCTRQIFRHEGVRGYFKGLGPNLAKTFGGALLLVAYDSFRHVL